MTIQQSSVPLAEQLWFNSQWRRPQAFSSTNQEVPGDPPAGGQRQKLRYFTNEEHNLCGHQKELLRMCMVICQLMCNSPSS